MAQCMESAAFLPQNGQGRRSASGNNNGKRDGETVMLEISFAVEAGWGYGEAETRGGGKVRE